MLTVIFLTKAASIAPTATSFSSSKSILIANLTTAKVATTDNQKTSALLDARRIFYAVFWGKHRYVADSESKNHLQYAKFRAII